jgi:hypothetical protein
MRIEFDQTEGDLMAAWVARFRFGSANAKFYRTRRIHSLVLATGGLIGLLLYLTHEAVLGMGYVAVVGGAVMFTGFSIWPTTRRLSTIARDSIRGHSPRRAGITCSARDRSR